jgi:predicted RNA-binding Zn-ribbon protein involved in translation (DUF1610 family)
MFRIQIEMPAEARNHTMAPCPECGGSLRDASAGGVPGEVECNGCGWEARWVETVTTEAGSRECVFDTDEEPFDPMELPGVAECTACNTGTCAWCKEEIRQATTHTYMVTVTGCSRKQADRVMRERLGHDEDYGFNYNLNW